MTEFKPCPFCGADLIEVHVNRMNPSSYIRCSGCSCQISISHAYCNDTPSGTTVDALAEMWNRRVNKEEKRPEPIDVEPVATRAIFAEVREGIAVTRLIRNLRNDFPMVDIIEGLSYLVNKDKVVFVGNIVKVKETTE